MRDVALPPEIETRLANGAALAISISAGKDSQAMLSAVCRLYRERGWWGTIFAIHADLGQIEWEGTTEHARRIAADNGVQLRIVRRADGRDMIGHWEARGESLVSQGKQGRPWSDAKNRFCTADLKRDPIDKVLREYYDVVSAEGIRAEESPARARKKVCERRTRICTRDRDAWTWRPILHWTTNDVLTECGSSVADLYRRQALYRAGHQEQALDGWKLHYVYVLGNKRLSCSFCILACRGDLENAARHNPVVLRRLVEIERRFGFDFQPGKPLADLLPLAGQVA